MTEKRKWTPEEVAVIQDGWIKARKAYPQVEEAAGQISDIGFKVRPWRILTDDRQIGAMRYKLTPHYQRDNQGRIVSASLRLKNPSSQSISRQS